MSKDAEYEQALEEELEKRFPWNKEHISMRDYFAAHALTVITNNEYDSETVARRAYRIADAMINERKKKK